MKKLMVLCMLSGLSAMNYGFQAFFTDQRFQGNFPPRDAIFEAARELYPLDTCVPPASISFDKHALAVTCVDLSRDGTQAVTGSDDGTICIWDTHTGRQLRKYGTYKHPVGGEYVRGVNSVQFDPTGTMLLSATNEGKVHMHFLNKRERVEVAEYELGCQKVCFGASKDHIIVAHLRGIDQFKQFRIHSSYEFPDLAHVWSLAYDGQNNVLAYGDSSGIVLLDAENNVPIHKFSLSYRESSCVDTGFINQGNALFGVCSNTRELFVWDRHSFELVTKLSTKTYHKGGLRAACFADDGSVCITGSRDGRVCRWRVHEKGECTNVLRQGDSINHIVCNQDATQFLAASENNRAVWYNTAWWRQMLFPRFSGPSTLRLMVVLAGIWRAFHNKGCYTPTRSEAHSLQKLLGCLTQEQRETIIRHPNVLLGDYNWGSRKRKRDEMNS